MDELKIHNFVIHKIEKEQNEGPNLLLSDRVVNDHPDISEIANKLDDTFVKKLSEMAVFESDSRFVSESNEFKRYQFLPLTQNLTRILADQLTNAANAKGGYLVFFECERNDRFLFVFLVRDVRGYVFKQSKGVFMPNEITHIDLNSVAMAARINLSQYASGDDKHRYITLARGNTDISDYFKNWIGIDKRQSPQQDCDRLLDILNKIDLPDELANLGEKEGRDALKRRAAEQIKFNHGTVNTRQLSMALFRDENRISEYAKKHAIVMNGEFPPTKDFSKKLYKVVVSADGIKFSADRKLFTSRKIRVEGNTVIIESPDFAREVDQQI